MLKCSSISEWKIGDKGITKDGNIVTVSEICGNRFIKIAENLEKKLYIPAHGEIEKLTEISLSSVDKALKNYGFGFTEIQLILWNLEHNSEKIVIIK